MLPVWAMLSTLLSSLILIWCSKVVSGGGLQAEAAARIIIWLVLLVALALELNRQCRLLIPSHRLSIAQVAARTLAIRCGLVGVLVFSSLMSALFSSWPATTFNFDYLLTLPFLLLVIPYYVAWAGRRLGDEEDGHERFGQLLQGRRAWCWAEQKTYVLAWWVKFFFIPLMYAFLNDALVGVLRFSWQGDAVTLVLGLFMFGLCCDLVIAFAGYLFSLRLLGGDIRSVDGTWLGWFSCMICYPPLLGIFHYIKQQVDGLVWSDWLLPNGPLYWVWAVLLSGTWLVYWVATASFGLKFSNLSWRGLVDRGPYRFTKHPAYLAKNIYWWLHTVPFIGVQGWADLSRNLLGLAFVSLVYYLRARTEEAHLMAFPEYAAYAAHIERHGLLARVRRGLGGQR